MSQTTQFLSCANRPIGGETVIGAPQVTPSADRLTAMVTISRVGPDLLRLDGWLAPPEVFRVHLRMQAGADHEAVADEFAWLARTPANAAKKALDRAGLQPGDIDLWEINEAFSSVALNSTRMLGIDTERVNVNGGAVALGHPIGASGARILGSLVLELRRRGGGYGCVAICSGGGQGDAVIVHV